MFRGGPTGGQFRARSLSRKQHHLCASSARRQDTHARASSSAAGAGANATARVGLGSSGLLVQGAVGVGIGLGLGLGFGLGVSNMLQLAESFEEEDGEYTGLSNVKGRDELELRLQQMKKGNKFQNAFGALFKKLQSWNSRRQVTDTLIQLNCLTFFLQKASKGWISAWCCKHNAAIAKGQLWRLFTPALLHGNLLHLLVNCYTLNHLGPTTEALFGGKRMLAVYVLSGVSGNVFSFYMNALPAVGSSGALFGLLGALGYFYYKHSNVLKKEHVERPLRSLNQMVLTNIVIGLTTPNIDNWAHMGGLLAVRSVSFLLSLPLSLSLSSPIFALRSEKDQKIVERRDQMTGK
eukprot:CAMPEP_0197486714 /NCGR_PEP_ID=MMETSP1311-20131121/1679_1 /TAXON_ID=464262 /ORGANISM="Genus nov. species nov., Strain RCC856" /LENGTH=349 /DNA_ID=CAMNT_0043029973 /DNA_START=302 /DNA_END=1351 /DNA_ORIENTATION=+